MCILIMSIREDQVDSLREFSAHQCLFISFEKATVFCTKKDTFESKIIMKCFFVKFRAWYIIPE